MVYFLSPKERSIYTSYAKLSLPRHTSYPAVPYWSQNFTSEQWREVLHSHEKEEISLYLHVPFCEKLCYYCGCTKNILPKDHPIPKNPAEDFLEGIKTEIENIVEHLGRYKKTLVHIHFGGGTPTYLSPAQLQYVFKLINGAFKISPTAEIACEIDPRVTTKEHLLTLKALGFNRLSLGIQDFDEKVQTSINRIQPFHQVANFVSLCRNLGFKSLNFDLIYGLPFQTRESVANTLTKVISLNPERIAYYRLAHIPELFRWQKAFVKADMPSSEDTLDFNLMAINAFQDAGYAFIGLDHFAKPEDELAQAFRNGTLQRNFQGMSTQANIDIIGIGPSAISSVSGAFAQNIAHLGRWRDTVEKGLATERGLNLTRDDVVRQNVLQELYCYRSLNLKRFSEQNGTDFFEYFSRQLPVFEELANDGLITIDSQTFQLTKPLGELLVRVVAAGFDAYLDQDSFKTGGSLGSSVG